MIRFAALGVILLSGCPMSSARVDATDEGPDGGLGVCSDAFAPDCNTTDAPEDGGVSFCSDVPLTASCFYGGYGSRCEVPCSFPPTCSFSVEVRWTGGHCCGGGETFFDCICERGFALCSPFPFPGGGSTRRTTPTSLCEFCGRDGG